MLEFVQNIPLLIFLALCFYLLLVACINQQIRLRIMSMIDHPRPPSSGKTVLALDSIRGIAILMVVSFHLFQWFNSGFADLGQISIIRNGWCGVELFVVLSGYLIYGAVLSGGFSWNALVKYAKRRFFRIYPVYFVSCIIGFLLIFYGLTAVFPSNIRSWPIQELLKYGFQEIFLMRSISWYIVETFNPPAWSLAVEISFYMVVPIYAFLAKRQALIASFLMVLLLLYTKHQGTREFGIVIFFWVGILLFEVQKHPVSQKLTQTSYFLLFIVGLIISLYFISGPWIDQHGNNPLFPRHHKTGILALGFFLMLLALLKNHKLAGYLSFYPLRAIGIVSYSLFLWHCAVYSLSGLNRVHDLNLYEALAMMIFLVLPSCLFVSGLSYVFIERPFLSRRF